MDLREMHEGGLGSVLFLELFSFCFVDLVS